MGAWGERERDEVWRRNGHGAGARALYGGFGYGRGGVFRRGAWLGRPGKPLCVGSWAAGPRGKRVRVRACPQGAGEEAAPGAEAPVEPVAVTDDDVKAVSARLLVSVTCLRYCAHMSLARLPLPFWVLLSA